MAQFSVKSIFCLTGKWRTQLLWRLFGVVLFQTILLQTAFITHFSQFFSFPIGLQLLSISCPLLIVFGSRLIVLLLTVIATFSYVIPILYYNVELQVSEEYILFIGLPFMGFLLTAIFWALLKNPGSTTIDEHIDQAHVSLFRIGLVTTMFFAGLAKFNYDFFNPTVSCMAMMTKLYGYWQLPYSEVITIPSPFFGAASEILIPAFLIVLPRIGLLYTFLLMGFMGHLGATPFSLIIIVMACAFFHNDDGAIILKGLKQYWAWLLSFLFVIAVISFNSFLGPRRWIEVITFQMTVIVLIFFVLYLLCADRKGKKKNEGLFFPKHKISYIILLAFFVLSLCNGFSTYLGLKYRLGFAMLSNLRVDHVRWNHMMIPKWVYLRKHDHSIRVHSVNMNSDDKKKMMRFSKYIKRGLYSGIFSPMSFKHRINLMKKHNISADLEIQYQGKAYFFKDTLNHLEFKQWIAQLPESKMFQEWLALEGPQPCLH